MTGLGESMGDLLDPYMEFFPPSGSLVQIVSLEKNVRGCLISDTPPVASTIINYIIGAQHAMKKRCRKAMGFLLVEDYFQKMIIPGLKIEMALPEYPM